MLLAVSSSAQNGNGTAINSSPEEGLIEISKDARIGELHNKFKSINEARPVMDGFRIQIFFASGTNSRKMANDTKANFIALYPDMPAYVKHEQPNFKVRVGDFRSKLDAQGYFRQIKKDFPGAFIVKDEIALPKID
jgi:hypothetical protein